MSEAPVEHKEETDKVKVIDTQNISPEINHATEVTKTVEKPPLAHDESIFTELWDFMRVRKKFWLAPILIALVLLGMLFFFAQTAGVVSPFIYAL